MVNSYVIEKKPTADLAILVVEDDEGLNNLISRTLQRAGFRTESALRGDIAIDKIISNEEMLIVLDYQLPDMTGKQVIERLIEMDKLIPFIMVTGRGDEKTAVEMMKLGARDYLTKDSGFMNSLPRVVRRVLDQVETEGKLYQAKAQLSGSEERFRQMSELSPFPMWFLTPDGQTEYTNPQFYNLFGYTTDEVPSIQDWFEVVFPKDEDRGQAISYWEGDQEALDNKRTVKREFYVRCKDGITRCVTVRYLRMEDRTIYVVFHDITEAKRAEEKIREQYDEIEVHAYELESSNSELRRAQEQLLNANEELQSALDELESSQEQLLQSAKMAAIGELVSGVAHELNNPLSAIAMHNELLDSKTDDERLQKHIEIIGSQTERSVSIVKNLLSFARKKEPVKEVVSINEAIESSVALRSYDLSLDNVNVIHELDRDNPRTMADFRQLQQIFLNIINNAAHSMKEANGKGELVIESWTIGDIIRISFTDNGPGIPSDKIDRIFEPFYTTKDVGQGTGLGLSICYGIVEEHGGLIYAESREGSGATFVIEMPLVRDTFDVPL